MFVRRLCFVVSVRKDLSLRLQFRFFNHLNRKSMIKQEQVHTLRYTRITLSVSPLLITLYNAASLIAEPTFSLVSHYSSCIFTLYFRQQRVLCCYMFVHFIDFTNLLPTISILHYVFHYTTLYVFRIHKHQDIVNLLSFMSLFLPLLNHLEYFVF